MASKESSDITMNGIMQVDEISIDLKEKKMEENETKINWHTWRLIVTILLLVAVSGMLYSLQGPFFPPLARSKGVSAFQYGFVYAAYELTIIFLSIPTGRISYKIGPKAVMLIGIFLTGIISILFGFIKLFNNRSLFFLIALLLRVFEGFGQATVQVGAVTLITVALPEASGTLIACTESMVGVGLFLGPALGGLLYDYGGFTLPFAAVGLFFLCAFPIVCWILPPYSTLKSGQMEAPSTLWKVLTIPKCWFGLFSISTAMLIPSYCTAVLEPHLLEYNLSGFLKGLVFLLHGLIYAIFSPVFGKLCDMGLNPIWGLLIGHFLKFVEVCLLGPAPFLFITKSLGIIIFGVVVGGISLGACIAPAFVYLMQSAHKAGYPNNVDTNSTISGMFISGLAIGQLIGPAAGGFLFDHYGFAKGALYLCIPSCCVVVFSIGIILKDIMYCTCWKELSPM